MNTFIAVCVGILTLTHLVGLCLIIYTLVQVHRSAEAVEVLAYQTQDQVEKFGSAAERMRDLAITLNSGWVRGVALGLSALFAFWSRQRRAKAN